MCVLGRKFFCVSRAKLEATTTAGDYLCVSSGGGGEEAEGQKGVLRSQLNQRRFWLIQSGLNREHKSHAHPKEGSLP